MIRMRWLAAAAVAAGVAASFAYPSPAAVSVPVPVIAGTMDAPPQAQLSVMTYNVKGLPFPAAFNRGPALQEIGARLAGLRSDGRQPHVVLLQEAFIADAKAIAAEAGYAHVALGPQPADLAKAPAAGMPAAYDAAASWSHGETEGKWADSGLVILSDYPIVASARMPFPEDTCAGFDCLATKGVLLAWVKVPGQPRPVAIADTHMNSRGASGVADSRADAAYARQVALARQFIAAHVSPQTSLVFGGDFNVGHYADRVAETANGALVPGAREVLAALDEGQAGTRPDADLAAVSRRGKDRQFFRPGTGQTLALEHVTVPFGVAAGGFDLSDHLGYVADYRLR